MRTAESSVRKERERAHINVPQHRLAMGRRAVELAEGHSVLHGRSVSGREHDFDVEDARPSRNTSLEAAKIYFLRYFDNLSSTVT